MRRCEAIRLAKVIQKFHSNCFLCSSWFLSKLYSKYPHTDWAHLIDWSPNLTKEEAEQISVVFFVPRPRKEKKESVNSNEGHGEL